MPRKLDKMSHISKMFAGFDILGQCPQNGFSSLYVLLSIGGDPVDMFNKYSDLLLQSSMGVQLLDIKWYSPI